MCHGTLSGVFAIAGHRTKSGRGDLSMEQDSLSHTSRHHMKECSTAYKDGIEARGLLPHPAIHLCPQNFPWPGMIEKLKEQSNDIEQFNWNRAITYLV